MDMPPATQGRRVSAVVDRNLDELCASLDDALSSRQRSTYAEKQLHDKIKAKTDFLRPLLAAEAECHGGARPVRLAEAEARFAVLKATFDQWAQRAVVAAPEPVEEEEVVGEPEEEEADCSGSSRSTCSCTDSCQEATEGDAKRDDVVEARNKEEASDVVDRNLDELCASLDDALSSRQRSPYAEKQLHDKIKAKTDFLRPLLAAEAECHGGARPVRLAEAEARFAVLKATFDQWAQRAVVAAPEPVEEETGKRAIQRRWWRQSVLLPGAVQPACSRWSPSGWQWSWPRWLTVMSMFTLFRRKKDKEN